MKPITLISSAPRELSDNAKLLREVGGRIKKLPYRALMRVADLMADEARSRHPTTNQGYAEFLVSIADILEQEE